MALVREYRARDIPEILRVLQAAFAEYHGLLDPPSSAEHKTIAIVEQELERAAALVAEHDQQVVGCVFYRPQGESVYLDRLAVLPGHRRQGIGLRLMTDVERRAVDAGYAKVILSVRLSLQDNQAYYRRHGYVAVGCGSHAGYADPTYVNMEKRLESSRGTMKLEEIDHIQITVRDIPAAAAWYRDVLGFEDDGNWAIGNAYKHIKAGGVRITLGLPEHESPHVAYCLDRESFEAKRAELAERGIGTRFKRNQYADMVYFRDPDGNTIELFTWNE